jgi:hypothetical protein
VSGAGAPGQADAGQAAAKPAEGRPTPLRRRLVPPLLRDLVFRRYWGGGGWRDSRRGSASAVAAAAVPTARRRVTGCGAQYGTVAGRARAKLIISVVYRPASLR